MNSTPKWRAASSMKPLLLVTLLTPVMQGSSRAKILQQEEEEEEEEEEVLAHFQNVVASGILVQAGAPSRSRNFAETHCKPF